MSDGVSSSVTYTLSQYADILCNDNGYSRDASGNPIQDSESTSGIASGYTSGEGGGGAGAGAKPRPVSSGFYASDDESTVYEETEGTLLSEDVEPSTLLPQKGQEPPILYDDTNENVQSVTIEDDYGRRVTFDSYRDRIVINDINMSYANFMEIIESLREPADEDSVSSVSANFDELKTVAAFAGTAGVLFAAVLSIWIYYILKAFTVMG
jgi:hypothetical protein